MALHPEVLVIRCLVIYTSRNFQWPYTLGGVRARQPRIYTSRNFQWPYTEDRISLKLRAIYTSRNFQWPYTLKPDQKLSIEIYTSRNFQWPYTLLAAVSLFFKSTQVEIFNGLTPFACKVTAFE